MSISITLPDDAAAFELAAAAQFFTTMAAGRHHYEVNGEFPNFRDAIGPVHVPVVNTVNVTGPTSAEERQAVTTAVEQIASTIAADQFPDVPEFPSAAEAFGSAPPVPPPPATITDAAFLRPGRRAAGQARFALGRAHPQQQQGHQRGRLVAQAQGPER